MAKFEIKVTKTGADYRVDIGGVVDEDADFNPHVLAGAQKVEMHLGQVKGINSCGIREWIKWVGTSGAAKVTYHECPKVIVDQINMVQGFLPAGGKVESFYVPYYSDEAGSEKTVLFRYGQEFTDNAVNPPAEVKDTDGNEMEMDVVEAKYFKFIKK